MLVFFSYWAHSLTKFSISESSWLDFEMCLFGMEEPTSTLLTLPCWIKLLYSFYEFWISISQCTSTNQTSNKKAYAIRNETLIGSHGIKSINSLKFSKRMNKFKETFCPNWDISKSCQFSTQNLGQKRWICMVQMLNVAIKQAFNYENV